MEMGRTDPRGPVAVGPHARVRPAPARMMPIFLVGIVFAPPEALAGLTGREREVMALAAEGRSNAEIAEVLFVSPLTVRTHVQRALTKLHARDRAQLVVIAYQSGLVRATPPNAR